MSELSRDARDLIAQAKQDGPALLGPSAQDRARMREKLSPLWAANASVTPALRPGRSWSLRLISGLLIGALGALSWLTLQAREPALAGSAVPPEAAARASTPTPPMAAVDDGLPAGQPVMAAVLSESVSAGALRGPDAAALLSPLSAAGERKPEVVERVGTREAARSDKHARSQALGRSGEEGELDGRHASAGAGTLHSAALASAAATGEVAATRASPAGDPAHPAAPASAAATDAVAATRASATDDSARSRAAGPGRRPLPPMAADVRGHGSTVRSDEHPTPASIDGELELLSAAQSALQQQRPTRALSLLQEHAFRFPSSALSEERIAMQALALCASGRKHAAQTVLSNTEARGAPSQLLPRVRSQCGL